MYCLISPFWCSEGGGCHESERELELTATPVGLKGGLVGATYWKYLVM